MKFLTTKYINSIYEPLAYIENTDTSYIATGVIPTTSTGVYIVYEYPEIDSSPAGVTGTYISSGNGTLFVSTVSGSLTSTKAMVSHRGKTLNSTDNVAANTEYTAKINWLNDGLMNINGSSTTQGTDETVNNTELRIFSRYYAANDNYAYTPAKVKRYKVSEGTSIIRDFIGVKRITDNVIGVYDLINDVFYSGSGTFTGGDAVILRKNLFFNKSGFSYIDTQNRTERVEYLEATYDSTQSLCQYIATDNTVDWSKDFVIKAVFQKTGNHRATILGCYPNSYTMTLEMSSGGNPRLYITAVSSPSIPVYDITLASGFPAFIPATLEFRWAASTGEYYFKVETIDKTYSDSSTGTLATRSGTSRKFMIFSDYSRASGVTSAFNGTLIVYKVEFDGEGTTKAEYIPVMRNRVACFYETISDKYYLNSGKGKFNVGRRVRPVEYLELTGTQYFNTYFYTNKVSDVYKSKFTFPSTATQGVMNGVRESQNYDKSTSFYMPTPNSSYPYSRMRLDWLMTTEGGSIYTNKLTSELHELEINGSYAIIDGATYTNEEPVEYTSTNPFYIGGCYTASNSSVSYPWVGKIYFGQLFKKTTLEMCRDCIPAIDEFKIPFFFDKVTNLIFDNIGTNTEDIIYGGIL